MRLPLLLTIAIASFNLAAPAEDWPQFRGPGGRAISETATPPLGFGPASNMLWKVAVPYAPSSPIVAGQRIFLTAVNAGKLETICLDRQNGHVLWRRPAAANQSEPGKDLDAQAQAFPTPVTDGKSVYVFFGSIGVIAYDLDGKEQWRQPIALPDTSATSSPILIGDKLILVCDKNSGSYVEARDKQTGRSLWRVERPQFHRSRATPFHWVHGGEQELIVPGTFSVTSYHPLTGMENWHYSGAGRFAISSPAASENQLFSVSANIDAGGDEPGDLGPAGAQENPLALPPVADPGLFAAAAPKGEPAMLAINSGGAGDITQTHLAWKSTRGLPYASSPLFYKGRLFTVKDGGLVSAYDVKNGRPIYQDERLDALGSYYASPVAAAGRIYFTSDSGTVTIISAAADTLTILAQNKIGEQVLATPALIGPTILFRTDTTLWSFGPAR